MDHPKRKIYLHLRRYVWTGVILWTLIVFCSMLWNLILLKRNIRENAKIQARSAFQKDISYRRWNALQGGIYVPVTEKAQPDPYLSDLPERDIVSPAGKRLTLINPAHMARLVHGLDTASSGIQSHVTSFRNIHPENSPDPWEEESLKKFEHGVSETSCLQDVQGTTHLRLMRPILLENCCFKCHTGADLKEGDILGGISLAIPLAPLRAAQRPYYRAMLAGHAFLWAIGLAGFSIGAGRLGKQDNRRRMMEAALRDSEERLRVLTSYLLKAQEEERLRIAHELHDELGQAMAVLKIQLTSVRQAMGKDQTRLKGSLTSTCQYVDQIVENVRRLSHNLSPAILEDLGLCAALRWLFNSFSEQNNIHITLVMEDIDRLFCHQSQLIIYRIFQEIFANIGKHSQATQVSVRIQKRNGEVTIAVEDNGQGFDIQEVNARSETQKGMGLTTMEERARMLGRPLERTSQKGQGTRIAFAVPFDRQLNN